MQAFVDRLSNRAKAAARSAALTAFGMLFCVVGVGFLTAGLWQWLAINYDGLTASLVVGAGYIVAGVGVLLVAPRAAAPQPEEPKIHHSRATAAGTEPFFQMAEGFAAGMQAGRAARRGRA